MSQLPLSGIVESDESWQASEALLRPKGAIETPTALDRATAVEVRAKIDAEVQHITDGMASLESSWVELGVLVAEVRRQKYWIDYGYQNYGEFMDEIAGKVKRDRSYMYQVKGVAEGLLPRLDASTLHQMGISKATELRKLAAQDRLDSDTVALALNPKAGVAAVKAAVQTRLNPAVVNEKGLWFDLGGFYLTDAEREQFEAVFEHTLSCDEPIKDSTPQHIQRKIVFFRWLIEYISAFPLES